MGIAGIIIGAIWWAASSARESQKENDAFNELQTVAQNINTILAGRTVPGPTPNDITANMITAQAIPSTYIDAAHPTYADNPWSPGTTFTTPWTGFHIWYINSKTFRVSFYAVRNRSGCLSLLLKATSCQFGQMDCPINAVVANGAQSLAPPVNSSTGWATVMTVPAAQTLCGFNSYTGGSNSVEFDYSL